MKFDNFFEKNREVLQLLYGVFLIVMIPMLILYNAVFIIKNYNKSIDVSLRKHAVSIGRALIPYVEENFDDKETLNKKILALTESNPELLEISIAVKESDKYTIVASSNEEEKEKTYNNVFYQLSYNQQINDGIANSSFSKDREDAFSGDGERYWEVGMPIQDGETKIGVFSMKISSKIIDDLTQENRNRSFYLLFGEVVVVILFLLLAVRFWDYVLLYKKIKEADQMKDEFISIASHELRTPVTGIKGYSSMMLDGSFGELNEKIKEGAKMIKGASERLGVLVDDLLNVSRIEQGRMSFDKKETDVKPIIEGIVDELNIQAKEKNLELKTAFPEDDLPKLNIDTERLKQVLVNLIGNSIKYTEKGSVIVSIELGSDNLMSIKIKDTGIGMNEEERKRLFQKFYRVQNEKTQKIVGTGLGLWITKKITEAMGGKIIVDSIKGTGTEISIKFPIIKK
ncbi:hypothetical protein C0584_01285 [Candidatus Parcubacteria bacterium]|nr:MAG: hypothetical protein C0584_01285 [Candidatus Parcubacteria bacterium]